MVAVEMADLYARLEVGIPLGTRPDIRIPPIPAEPLPPQMKAQK